MRTVAELMTRGPIVIDCNQSLAEAAQRMTLFNLRHLPVIGGKGLVGLLSECDVYRLERSKPHLDPDVLTVAEAMSLDPYVVPPDAPIARVARAMADKRIGAAVVMDGDRIAGVFTPTDALRALAAAPQESGVGRPKKILCAIDLYAGSREALAVALDQARTSNGTVTLFHALERPPVLIGDALQVGTACYARLDEETDTALRDWKRNGERTHAVEVSTAKGVGPAWQTITRHAADNDFDLIVIGTRGRTGIARVIVGSVAENVVRHAHCPVLVVPSRQAVSASVRPAV